MSSKENLLQHQSQATDDRPSSPSSADSPGSGKPADSSVADQSRQSNKDDEQEESHKVVDETEEEGASDPTSAWTTAWDEGSQAYYWWNMVTYETTWENPYEKKNDTTSTATTTTTTTTTAAAAAAAAAAATTTTTTDEQDPSNPENDSNSKQQERQYPRTIGNPSYSYQAYFNARTGRFQTSSEVNLLNPERMSIEHRATRQMQYFFDVDAYTEERNRERAANGGQKRPLSKREIEKFKKARHDKKMKRAREWLCD